MEITEQICTNNLVAGFAKSYPYFLPVGTKTHKSISNGTDYVSWPEEGCIQKFSYKLDDGTTVPEITVNPINGDLTFEAASTRLKTYNFKLIIHTTEAPKDVHTEIEGLSITVTCGPDSTVPILPPNYEPMIRMADLGGRPTINAKFTS